MKPTVESHVQSCQDTCPLQGALCIALYLDEKGCNIVIHSLHLNPFSTNREWVRSGSRNEFCTKNKLLRNLKIWFSGWNKNVVVFQRIPSLMVKKGY